MIDTQFMTSMLNLCAEHKELERVGKRDSSGKLQQKMSYKSTQSDLILSSSLVNMYGKCGMVKEAKEVSFKA